jgi:hypothetical protein
MYVAPSLAVHVCAGLIARRRRIVASLLPRLPAVCVCGWWRRHRYTMEVCAAAVAAGADVLVLCDTNGGALAWDVHKVRCYTIHDTMQA